MNDEIFKKIPDDDDFWKTAFAAILLVLGVLFLSVGFVIWLSQYL